jgi:hypothetical protein
MDQSSATMGQQLGQTHIGAGQSARDTGIAAQQGQFSAQLGADAATDAQRQQYAKDTSAHAKFQQGLGTATLGILGGS